MLLGAGLSDLPFLHVPWVLHVAIWVLAVASLVTIGQRVHTRAVLGGRHGAAAERGVESDAAGTPATTRGERAVTAIPTGHGERVLRILAWAPGAAASR